MKWVFFLLMIGLAPSQVAVACSSVPGWSIEATYEGDEAIALAEVTSVTEARGVDGSLEMEYSFRVLDAVRGDLPTEGAAVEIMMPAEPAEPNSDGVVFEIACSNRILYRAFVGRPHLLFLQPMADGRWQVRWGSTPIPDPSTPDGEFLLSEVRRFASPQRPR